jgi:hypothetical protein
VCNSTANVRWIAVKLACRGHNIKVSGSVLTEGKYRNSVFADAVIRVFSQCVKATPQTGPRQSRCAYWVTTQGRECLFTVCVCVCVGSRVVEGSNKVVVLDTGVYLLWTTQYVINTGRQRHQRHYPSTILAPDRTSLKWHRNPRLDGAVTQHHPSINQRMFPTVKFA